MRPCYGLIACAAACWAELVAYAPQPLQFLDCPDDIGGRLLHCRGVRPTDAAWRAWGMRATPRDAANFTDWERARVPLARIPRTAVVENASAAAAVLQCRDAVEAAILADAEVLGRIPYAAVVARITVAIRGAIVGAVHRLGARGAHFCAAAAPLHRSGYDYKEPAQLQFTHNLGATLWNGAVCPGRSGNRLAFTYEKDEPPRCRAYPTDGVADETYVFWPSYCHGPAEPPESHREAALAPLLLRAGARHAFLDCDACAELSSSLRAGSGAAQELLAALDPKDRGHATIAHAAGAVLAHEFVARRTPLDGWEHGAPGAKAREAFADLLESFVHPGLMHGFLYTLVAERERAVRAFGTSSEAWGYDLCAGLFDAGTGGFAYADPLTAQFDQCAHGVGHGLYLARRTCGEYGPVGAGAARERWSAMCVNGWRMEHILWRTRRVGFAYPR